MAQRGQMYKVFIALLIIMFLSGCGIYNLDNFTIPNDIQFLECVAGLDTVPLIAQYMEDNFTYKIRPYNTLSPYGMWKIREGDCTDYGAFGVFAARYNGIEAYQVLIYYSDGTLNHINAVYKVEDYWVLTDSWVYHEKFLSINEAIIWHSNYSGRVLKKYKILEN